jgi:tetratricopeptide (TPR) repeat protein
MASCVNLLAEWVENCFLLAKDYQMATNTPDTFPQDFQEDLEGLMASFAGLVWRGASAEEVVGRIARHGAGQAPTIAAMVAGNAGVDGFFRLLGRSLWNAMPQPAHDFRLLTLAEPGRNDPCICGSLRKYKQCCAGAPTLPIEPPLMLWHLLRVMPRKHWHTLAHSHINRDWVLSVADQWREEGDYESAVQLLEPWFKGDGAIADQDAELLDMLLDTYLQLDKPRKRKLLAQAAIARGGREVKCVGWQRLTLMEIDAGNPVAARTALNEAMRASPDNPDMALLEIQCLLSEGKDQIARERAKFWHARTAKLHDPALKEHLDWLLAISENPRAAMFNALANKDETLQILESQILGIGAPQCHYKLSPFDGSTGPFEPTKALAKAELLWRKTFPVNKPASTSLSTENFASWDDDPHAWLTVLKANPILWHSFDVVDDVVGALDNHIMAGVADILLPLLLSHAEALFDKVVNEHAAAAFKCEWGWMENRPALRLLVRNALDNQYAPDPAKREAAFELIRRLVETLNPNDNHGLRTMVVAGLVARGKAEDAIKLAANYPEDMANLEYTRVLALFAAGRLQDAEQAVQKIHSQYPKVGKMLVAASPRQPRFDPYGYKLGSPQEAWLYRESYLATWQAQAGALAWLAKILRLR